MNVSLPKKWATEKGINSGSIVFITQNQNGDLILSADRSEQDQIAKIDIGNKMGDPLIRDIIACYIAGYRIVEISSPYMTAIQKRDLHSIVNKLIGPEILEETINKLIIRDLLSSDELHPDRALTRIKNMVRSMIHDSMDSVAKKNKELAADVIQRDDDVDRLNLLMARQFSEILRSGSVRHEAIDPVRAFNYVQAAANLERIADHASQMAEIACAIDYELPLDMAEELSKLGSVFPSLIDESITVLLNADSDKANRLIDKAVETKANLLAVTGPCLEKSNDKMLIRLASSGSMERMFDLIINIAELAINLHNAMLKSDHSV